MAHRNPSPPDTPPRRRVTIHDVATRAGVSIGTASRILNGQTGKGVWKSARLRAAKIRAVAAKLGYTPNWGAQTLATGKTQAVGLMYSGALPPFRLAYEPLLTELATALRERGYALLFLPLADPEDAGRRAAPSVDGYIAYHKLTPAMAQILKAGRKPAVLLNVAEELPPYPTVRPDDQEGGALVARHLLDLGHRRIGFVSFNPRGSADFHFSTERRRAGFLAAMRAAGRDARASRWQRPCPEEADALVAELLALPPAQRPTALVVDVAYSAMRLIHAAWRRGLRVPADCSIVTFDDIFIAACAIPPLTVVAVPMAAMGRRAADRLLAQLDGASPDPTPELLPPTLIVRESTARRG